MDLLLAEARDRYRAGERPVVDDAYAALAEEVHVRHLDDPVGEAVDSWLDDPTDEIGEVGRIGDSIDVSVVAPHMFPLFCKAFQGVEGAKNMADKTTMDKIALALDKHPDFERDPRDRPRVAGRQVRRAWRRIGSVPAASSAPATPAQSAPVASLPARPALHGISPAHAAVVLDFGAKAAAATAPASPEPPKPAKPPVPPELADARAAVRSARSALEGIERSNAARRAELVADRDRFAAKWEQEAAERLAQVTSGDTSFLDDAPAAAVDADGFIDPDTVSGLSEVPKVLAQFERDLEQLAEAERRAAEDLVDAEERVAVIEGEIAGLGACDEFDEAPDPWSGTPAPAIEPM